MFQISSYELDLTFLLFTKYEAKKNTTTHVQAIPNLVLPQTQVLNEVTLPQAQVLGELVLEPINKALQEENGRLKTEIGILKEREICKQELMDEYKARAKNLEEENLRAKEENQRGKDEIQRFRDELSSVKEKEARLTVEVEYLKRRDEGLRAERNAERVMFQSMMSNLMNGIEDRKRNRNDDSDETK
jgi:predicted nuclease with TOPRIM domain